MSVSIPLGMRHFFMLLLLLVVFFTIFSFVAEIRRKVTVNGVIMPKNGFIEVTSPNAGTISDVHVLNGQFVEKGQPILSITNQKNIAGGRSYGQEQVSLLERQLELLTVDQTRRDLALKNHLEFLDNQILIQEQEIKANKSNLNLAIRSFEIVSKEVAQAKHLKSTKVFSDKQLDSVVQNGLSSEEKVRLREIDIISNKRRLNELRHEKLTIIDSAKKDNNEQEKQIESLREKVLSARERFQFTIRSPLDGIVQFNDLNNGASITQSDTLIYIFPKKLEYIAQIYAPSMVIGLIEVEMNANLRIDGYPFEFYGSIKSKITEISTTPNSRRNLFDAEVGGKVYYTVRADLDNQYLLKDNKQFRLQPGMSFSADIWLEKRSLAFLVFEPFIKLKNRI